MGLARIKANDTYNRDDMYAEADKFLYQAVPNTDDKKEVALNQYHSGIKRNKGLSSFRYFGVTLSAP